MFVARNVFGHPPRYAYAAVTMRKSGRSRVRPCIDAQQSFKETHLMQQQTPKSILMTQNRKQKNLFWF